MKKSVKAQISKMALSFLVAFGLMVLLGVFNAGKEIKKEIILGIFILANIKTIISFLILVARAGILPARDAASLHSEVARLVEKNYQTKNKKILIKILIVLAEMLIFLGSKIKSIGLFIGERLIEVLVPAVCVVLDLIFYNSHLDVLNLIVVLGWTSHVFRGRRKVKSSFSWTLAFIFLCLLFYSAGRDLIAEKLAIWFYLSFLIFAVHLLLMQLRRGRNV